MKKGFTIIEIILSIGLILIIGVSATFIMINSKSKNGLNGANNTILKAASLYAKTEKDAVGKSFYEQVLSGAKGVQISLKNLVDKGYIEESVANLIYNENDPLPTDQDYYVLLATNHDYCDDGSTIILLSWMNQGEEVYLCDNAQKEELQDIINQNNNDVAKLRLNMNKIAVSKEYYDSIIDENKDNYLTYEENGLFSYYNEELDVIYTYYRGAVDNNYIKLGCKKSASGDCQEDLYWRILWKNDDNKMKLVLDSEVPVYLTNDITEENYKISELENNTLYYYRFGSSGSSNKYTFINPQITYEVVTNTNGDRTTDYFYAVQSKYFFNSFIGLEDNPYSNNWFYDKKNTEWYNSTNLSEYEFILKENNFCVNHCMNYDVSLREFSPSNDFDCKYGVVHSGGCEYDKSKYVSSPVGYLNYGDLIRAGIPISSTESLLNSGNYLINSQNNVLTSDLYIEDASLPASLGNFYFSDKGLSKSYISDYSKGKSYCGSTRCIDYDYTLNKIDGEDTITLVNNYYSYGSNFLERTSTFIGEVLKPVIVIDTTNITLSDSKGTKENSYTIIT